jgi:two-component system CheB/CheR fusion protein
MRDGVVGARSIAKAGGFVIAQHPETCQAHGMPAAVIEAGLTTAVLTADAIGDALQNRMAGMSFASMAADFENPFFSLS